MKALALPGLLAAGAVLAAPSFDCRRVEAGSIAALVCRDEALSALDRTLAEAYRQAQPRARQERPPRLAATQRGWVKGRDDCWKATDQRACVEDAYVRRIVELQAMYRLLPPRGPVRLACNGDVRDEVVVNYFGTRPPSLVAERGDEVSLMLAEPVAGGTRYVGRNEELREHSGEVIVRWGFGAPEMRCTRAP